MSALPPTDTPGNQLGLKPFISRALDSALTLAEAEEAFEVIMSGQATAAQIGGFLMILRLRGESIEEITGAASIMRAR
jgi:anthranilate phosphoribosyltransferase